jgi:hypothetical protein
MYADIEKRRAYDRAYHANRTPAVKARKQQLQAKRGERNLLALREFKAEAGCMDCGENDPIVLEFDHRDREDKDLQFGDCARQGWSLAKLMEEAKKCDVVCANCHRRRTARQMGWRQ